jgi:uncharacterized DUF497 family protein
MYVHCSYPSPWMISASTGVRSRLSRICASMESRSTKRLRLLVVIHCYHSDDAVIRLISAWKATPSERAQYGARWNP